MRAFALLVLCAMVGCSNSSGPALTPVAGTVTFNGKPFAGARVRFIPQGATEGHGGEGKTNAEGRYEAIAGRGDNRKGLLPGDYKVAVTRLLLPDGKPLPPSVAAIDSDARESAPEIFAKPHLTPLFVTIGTEAKTFDISLDERK